MSKWMSIVVGVILLAAWTAFVAFGFGGSGYLLKSAVSGDTNEDFMAYAEEKSASLAGNLALGLLEEGKLSEQHYYSIDTPVDPDTFFRMASITKWVTAWGVLELVEQGAIDLDAPVGQYLKRWQLPESEFDAQKVTVRRLLTHTAGLNHGAKFRAATTLEEAGTLEEYLEETKLSFPPGEAYRYSNNGYAILQMVIEDVSGMSFEAFMRGSVLEPLGLTDSMFVWDDDAGLKLATPYDEEGNVVEHFRYADQATGTLYTTVGEFSRFLKAHIASNPVLDAATIEAMSENQVAGSFQSIGLGPKIYGQSPSGDTIIGHGGLERWTVESQVLLNLGTGDGIIAFSNGTLSFAHELGEEWLFWKYGIVGGAIQNRNKSRVLTLLVVGYVLIGGLLWFTRKKRP